MIEAQTMLMMPDTRCSLVLMVYERHYADEMPERDDARYERTDVARYAPSAARVAMRGAPRVRADMRKIRRLREERMRVAYGEERCRHADDFSMPALDAIDIISLHVADYPRRYATLLLLLQHLSPPPCRHIIAQMPQERDGEMSCDECAKKERRAIMKICLQRPRLIPRRPSPAYTPAYAMLLMAQR